MSYVPRLLSLSEELFGNKFYFSFIDINIIEVTKSYAANDVNNFNMLKKNKK